MATEAFSPQAVGLYRQQVYAAVEKEEYVRNKMPRENLSIFLDVPPDVSHVLLAERKQKFQEDDEYTDRLDVQNRLYNEYDFMCNEDLKRFARIKCVMDEQLISIDEVAELVWSAVVINFPHLEHHG